MKAARNAVRVATCLLILFWLGAGVAHAQSDLGKISGFVKDPSGAVVPNAKVTIKNNTGVERSATTNDSGFYVISNVPPGLYTMTAEASGFQKFESNDNKLDPSGNLLIDATLTVGSANQTVEVAASAQTLQTESATVQNLVTRQQIDALELNGRNPVLMANLVPGTRGGALSTLSFNFSQGPSNINGARTPESLITYDGAPAVRTRSNGTSLGSADVDSTQEIQILTADYAPEYGRSSGGQIRITSKAGGQDFHGAAYEYVRNTVFNANPWQRNANPLTTGITAPIHYNQFGYNVGGPLYIPNHFNTDKTKIFWYWGQEWVRYVFTDTSLLLVPTLKMRQGDFSELLDPKNIFYGKAVQLMDPKTGLPINGNILPAPGTTTTGSTASANGLGILNSYPAPNLTTPINGDNWFFSAKHPQNQRKDTLAIDVNLTDKQRLRFRRVYFTFFEFQPLDGGTNETPKFFNRPNWTYSLDHVWVLSPKMVNEVLLTYSQDVVHIPVDAAHFQDRTQGVVQGAGYFGLNYPYIFPTGKLLPNRIPTVNMSNISTLSGGPYPSHSAGPIYDASDSFTWIHGNHTFKFGGLYEYSGENDNDEINVQACSTCTNNQNGQFLFSNNGGNFVRPGNVLASSGAAVANAALGLFDTYSEIGHRAYTVFRSSMYESFAQDSWKVRQNLTIVYGARYTINVPYHSIWNNMIVFNPSAYNPANAVTIDPTTGLITGTPTISQLYNGMVIPGSGFPASAIGRVPEATSGLYNGLFRGISNHYSDVQWGDIAPRLGIAYQVNNKTVVRVGGGRYFTRLGVSDSIFLGGNPPFQPNANVSFGSVDNPGGNGTNPLPLVVTTQSKAFKSPEAWSWNTTVERQLPWKSQLSVAYVGRRGLHLQREADINQPTTDVIAANPGVNINALRPYKGFASIRETDNVANSIYHSLQIAWNRHFSNSLQFGVAYTLSKSMDNGSNQRDVVPDTYNPALMWGPSEFDARNILVINYLYELPFFRHQSGLMGRVLGGWQVSGITQYQTGLPCSVAAPNDYAGVGLDSNFGCGVNGQFWVVNGSPSLVKTFGPKGQWFTTTNPDGSPIFTAPTKGTFNGQLVRDLIYQPGFENWNMGLFKEFPINEKRGFQFRAEAYNVFNHPNWCGASGCSGSTNIGLNPTNLSTFGKVLTKGGGSSGSGERNLQLSLRLYF
ncbi:MAG TPA: carboxypeptidase regulatory-like domain-containing protein [Candidatus Acidoferrum sp.]|nr:carboxypeptidase regulatory-like domain-containing protein [Candidatus Acidoferrum sp.]